jgi:hypothetical protein
LFDSLIDLGQEGKNVIRDYGIEVSFAKLGKELGKDRLVGSGSAT